MNKSKYVENIFNKNGKTIAEMRIYTEIGDKGVNATDFANEIYSLKADRLNVRFNTIGGAVIDAFGILSAMLNFKEKGGELHTYNDGLAASAGGWLLLAADPENVHFKDYALLMLHGVSNDVKGSLFKKSILKIFKNRSGLDVSELMNNGKDNFFDAIEASKRGFFPSENIENTGLKIDMPENYSLLEITNSFQNINKEINLKPLKMKKVINLLQLQEGADEELVLTAVKNALKSQKDSADALLLATNKVKDQDAEILELKGKVDVAEKATANTYVEAQIKDGKFTPKNETEKEALVAQYKSNPKGFEAMVNMMPTKAANILDGLEDGEDGVEAIMDKIANRSLREIEKEDPDFLAQIKNEASAEFVNLWNKQYGTNKTEADFK